MTVRCMKASDREAREFNRAAKIHNEGELVGVALDERFGKIAAKIAREGKMSLSVEAAEAYRSLNDAEWLG